MMWRILSIAFILVFSWSADSAKALVYSDPNFLRSVFEKHGVRVTISDRVKDGCWSKPQESKDRAAEALAANNIRFSEDSPITLQLAALGLETENGACIVTYDFKLGYLKLIEERAVEGLLLLAHHSGFNAGRGDRTEKIDEGLGEFIDEIAAAVANG